MLRKKDILNEGRGQGTSINTQKPVGSEKSLYSEGVEKLPIHHKCPKRVGLGKLGAHRWEAAPSCHKH